MSSIDKCDRCGRIGTFASYTFNFNLGIFKGNIIDLCPSCNKEFKKWLKQKK